MLKSPSLADILLPSVCRGSSRWCKWKRQGHTGETKMVLFISVPNSSNHNCTKILRIFLKGHPYVCSTSDKWPVFWEPGHHNVTADHSEPLQSRPWWINVVQDESISHACFKSAFTQNASKHWKGCKSADHGYSVISLGALWQESQQLSGSLSAKSSCWHEICLQDWDNILR